MRIVDADDAVDRFEELKPKGSSLDVRYAYGVSVGLEMAKHVIMSELSTVDAVPVQHGQWIDIDSETYTWKIRCNKCGHERSMMSTGQIYPMYCEGCGARMDGKDGDLT